MIDTELFSLIAKERRRQEDHLELIASENYVSAEVQAALGSCLTNKYAEGYPGHRYYGGCDYVDEIEDLARQRACDLFGAEHSNVQPHSGSQANMAAYMALIKPGDKILAASLNSGGHLTHSSPVSFVGKLYDVVTYDVDPTTGCYDYDAIREIAKRERPKLIVCGASAYPRAIDFKLFREIANEVNAYLVADMAHIAGLVAAGLHESPVPYADIVTTTTHKTLRGPRGGMILCKKNLSKAVDSAVFPRVQGGPLMHVIAAKAVCLEEAARPEFNVYQRQIVLNARLMTDVFKKQNINLVSGGTDNHLMLLDLRNTRWTGKALEQELDSVGITVNKNMIPRDPRTPSETSGIRIGTPAITTRGMDGEIAAGIAVAISELITGDWNYYHSKNEIAEAVKEVCSRYPIPGGFI